MARRIPYPYYQICFDCGSEHGSARRSVMGMWSDLCPVCGEVKTCAAAGYDFGVYDIDPSFIKREKLFMNDTDMGGAQVEEAKKRGTKKKSPKTE